MIVYQIDTKHGCDSDFERVCSREGNPISGTGPRRFSSVRDEKKVQIVFDAAARKTAAVSSAPWIRAPGRELLSTVMRVAALSECAAARLQKFAGVLLPTCGLVCPLNQPTNFCLPCLHVANLGLNSTYLHLPCHSLPHSLTVFSCCLTNFLSA